MTVYVTFGQDHRHEIEGVVFDKDCVAAVSSREQAFEFFGSRFCTTHEDINHIVDFFPRGVIDVHGVVQPTEHEGI
jgi:hypothetical protein